MATDIFGYDKPVKSEGQIASSDFAAVTVGNKQSLVQSVTVDYGQQITPVSQIGDTQIYWVTSRPEGTLNVSKLVGSSGFFDGWKNLDCGKISNLAVSVDGGRCGFTGSGNLTFTGGVIQSVSVRLGTDQTTIGETCVVKIASLGA